MCDPEPDSNGFISAPGGGLDGGEGGGGELPPHNTLA